MGANKIDVILSSKALLPRHGSKLESITSNATLSIWGHRENNVFFFLFLLS